MVADLFGVRVQLFTTRADRTVVVEPPVGAGEEIIRLHRIEHAGQPADIQPILLDPPGLGRGYRPSSLRAVPAVNLAASRRIELPQATWYFTGEPDQGQRAVVLSHQAEPDRLTVFLGAPGTPFTRELAADAATELATVPFDVRPLLDLVVFADPAIATPLLREMLGAAADHFTFTNRVFGLGRADGEATQDAGTATRLGLALTVRFVPVSTVPPVPSTSTASSAPPAPPQNPATSRDRPDPAQD